MDHEFTISHRGWFRWYGTCCSSRRCRQVMLSSSSFVAHDRESESSRSFVRITIAKHFDSNQHISIQEVDSSAINSTFWADQICLAIAVRDLKASHIALTIFSNDLDTRDWILFESNWLKRMSWHTKRFGRFTCIVSELDSSKIYVILSPSTPRNLFDPLASYLLITL